MTWIYLTPNCLDHIHLEGFPKRWRLLHQGQPLSGPDVCFCECLFPSIPKCLQGDLTQGNIQDGPKGWWYWPGSIFCQAAAVNCSSDLLKSQFWTHRWGASVRTFLKLTMHVLLGQTSAARCARPHWDRCSNTEKLCSLRHQQVTTGQYTANSNLNPNWSKAF